MFPLAVKVKKTFLYLTSNTLPLPEPPSKEKKKKNIRMKYKGAKVGRQWQMQPSNILRNYSLKVSGLGACPYSSKLNDSKIKKGHQPFFL